MPKKKWKTINGFKNIIDGFYQVSYEGDVRIKSTKEVLHKKVANRKHHPYYAVNLKLNTGKKEWVLVHQLVATFFVKIPNKYKFELDLVPDHLDNNGLNNNYTNLEWKTRGENTKSAHDKGYIKNSCSHHSGALITNKQAHKICKYLETGLSYDEIMTKMNFEKSPKYRQLLVRIKNRLAWTEISCNYKFDSDSVKYTQKQLETISKLPKIRKLISEGLSNYDIIREVWGNLDSKQMKSKNETITKIRKNKLFKEIP